MTRNVEVRGADRMRATLGQASRDIADLTDTHSAIGDLVHRAGRPPVRTGRLRSSRTVTAKPHETILGARTSYAAAVHQGARGVAARPWLTDAITRTQPAIEKTTLRALDDALSNVEGI